MGRVICRLLRHRLIGYPVARHGQWMRHCTRCGRWRIMKGIGTPLAVLVAVAFAGCGGSTPSVATRHDADWAQARAEAHHTLEGLEPNPQRETQMAQRYYNIIVSEETLHH